MRPPIIGIPIKPFGIAKRRLEARLSPSQRSILGTQIAAHTIDAARRLAPVVVVSADAGVQAFARRLGAESVAEATTGLDGAAAALQAHAHDRARPWLLLHADLPLLEPEDVAQLICAQLAHGAVIAPSHDGGTSALGASVPLRTVYGPGSFRRHLRLLDSPRVVVRPGTAYDLDTVADLDRLQRLRPGMLEGG